MASIVNSEPPELLSVSFPNVHEANVWLEGKNDIFIKNLHMDARKHFAFLSAAHIEITNITIEYIPIQPVSRNTYGLVQYERKSAIVMQNYPKIAREWEADHPEVSLLTYTRYSTSKRLINLGDSTSFMAWPIDITRHDRSVYLFLYRTGPDPVDNLSAKNLPVEETRTPWEQFVHNMSIIFFIFVILFAIGTVANLTDRSNHKRPNYTSQPSAPVSTAETNAPAPQTETTSVAANITETAAAPIDTNSPIQYRVISSSRLNVRNGASTTSEIIGKLDPGSIVSSTGTFSEDGAWAEIIYGETTGWVSSNYIQAEN